MVVVVVVVVSDLPVMTRTVRILIQHLPPRTGVGKACEYGMRVSITHRQVIQAAVQINQTRSRMYQWGWH